jgi:hypothetical protein
MSLLLADQIILPRYITSKKRLREMEAEGRVEVDLPAGASTSYMSVNRHTVAPPVAGGGTIRQQLTKALSKRIFVIYLDGAHTSPVRCIIYPAITKGEMGDMIRAAGYESKYASADTGKLVGSFSLLTDTSKMGCLSFNLPAGPRHMLGTCPAARLGFMYQTATEIKKAQASLRDKSQEIDPVSFICNGCYAMKNNYGNPSNIAIMQARLVLTNALLANEGVRTGIAGKPVELLYMPKKPRGKIVGGIDGLLQMAIDQELLQGYGGGFSDMLSEAIELATEKVIKKRQRLRRFGFSVVEFEEAEQWEGEVTAAKAAKRKSRVPATYYDWQLPDPRYFRIHDAGDMFSDGYLKAWLKVCTSLPKLRFWAPTRMWSMAKALKSVGQVPENLALRPSTLHFRDEAPTEEYIASLGLPVYQRGSGGGFSAASGSAPESPSKSDWMCPAYLHWTKGGGALQRLKDTDDHGIGGTCATARGPDGEGGCRVCWNGDNGRYHWLKVFYQEH